MEVVKTDNPPEEKIEDSSFVNEVKLQKYDKNLYGLNRNGIPMRCPIISAGNYACNSNCPLFLMRTKHDTSWVVTLGCGSGHTEHEIKEILPFVKKK